MPDHELPLTFRQEIMQPLVDTIRAGESCSLVGVGSSGKSNITRFFRERADARQKYFGAVADQVLWLLVDCNALDNYDEPSLYAGMVEALIRVLAKRDNGAKAAEILNNLLRETITFRHVQRALEAVRAVDDFLIVFVLDDCDQLIQDAPPVLLRRLRALRDEFKLKLMYVTVTRRELHTLRPHSAEFETFYELMVTRTFAVGPYTEPDARFMLARLAARLPEPRPIDSLEATKLIQATGGHPGLLKAAFYATRAGAEALEPNLIEILTSNAGVMDEARKIWESVEEFEHEGLKQVASGKGVQGGARTSLIARGLLRERTDESVTIFCPIFESLVAQKAGVPFDLKRETTTRGCPKIAVYGSVHALRVRVEDKAVEFNLVEAAILQLLVQQRGMDVSRADLLEVALAAETATPTGWGKIDQVLDRAVQNIRQKIEPPNALHPCIIATVAGGYRLLE